MDKRTGKRRLELAVRRNEGKRLVGRFLEDVACLVKPGIPIILLDLEKTDEIWESYQTKLASCSIGGSPCDSERWAASEIEEVKKKLRRLTEQIPSMPMFLFRSASEYCGAIESTSKDILQNALQLVSLDQEDLMASNADASFGFLFEYTTVRYPTPPSEEYHLVLWGHELVL